MRGSLSGLGLKERMGADAVKEVKKLTVAISLLKIYAAAA